MLAIGQERTSLLLQHELTCRIVQIGHADLALMEQQCLGIPIGFHGLVEIQMILRQIGKCTDGKFDSVYAIQHQRMRGYLHDDMRTARIAHLCEQFVQFKRFRRGALGRQNLIANHVLVGADEADCVTLRLKNGLEQIRRCGLAVGAGDADHDHAVSRMIKVVGCHLCQRTARRIYADIRHRNAALRHMFEHNHTRAQLDRLADVLVTIGFIAGDCHKDISVLYLTGIIFQLTNFHSGVCGLFRNVDALENLFQFHVCLLIIPDSLRCCQRLP